ncbi:MotA/TolQ/ExbB proton channel [Leptothrix cholodnii SP-6]|uniref:Biopolymer transport protein ExbB n=1 Tax=Leptothrix cholodnii (strain ATCC 51168 / LMG 8142 / SP-6) TaxID=395495 RepID=B1Y1N0_LEPCP|nr:MotA/TolQ/ExbB proton channel family protein [Leptothrix cholodnii]ACB35492.1 MotA/TolQ/ExbB proton channel [Leptothrix cholodnii SP-6]
MSLTQRLIRIPAALLLAAGLAFGAVGTAQAQAAAPTEAAAATTAVPQVETAKPSDEAAENPYGLKAMIEHGDMVAKGVLGLLMIMSLGTWYLLVTKALEQRKLLREAKSVGAGSRFWTAGTLRQGSDSLAKDGAFRFIADTALEASQKHDGVLAGVDLGSWITTSLEEAGEEVEHRLQKGLAFLATVGSTSPFIGLFGTVWGILNALTAIGVAGQASIDKVAGPVGEALIMTAIGLAVAVPAVLGYNWLVGRNSTALHYVTTFGSKLRATLLASAARA